MNPEQLNLCSKNPILLKQIINQNYPLSLYLDTSKKTLFCPFHHNTVTESAQLYLDTDGIHRIYCFAENRQYTAYDYIKLILNKNPLQLLYNVQMDDDTFEEEQEKLNKKEALENIEIENLAKKHSNINDFFTELYSLKLGE